MSEVMKKSEQVHLTYCGEDTYGLLAGDISKVGSEYFVKSLKWSANKLWLLGSQK